jgi:RNA polymerase sigma factor (sigma-70 family)
MAVRFSWWNCLDERARASVTPAVVPGRGKLVHMHDERRLALLAADRRRLVRAATRLLGPADAEDAVQDAFVRALEADAPVAAEPQAWLLTVMRRLAIDRLRRRRWMHDWLTALSAEDPLPAWPWAETNAALMEEAGRALRLLAAHLTPADSAVVLLHEVFEFGHAEIASVSGSSEAGSRQQLRRALIRLREAARASETGLHRELRADEEMALRLYLQSLQSLQLRDPRSLWAMLPQPAIGASSATSGSVSAEAAASPVATACGVVQMGGQLGLVLSLDGVTLCVLPVGLRAEADTSTEDEQHP